MPATSGELTVVVCTRNRCRVLDVCLSALLAHARGDAFDVLVVDNGSTDGTSEVVARWERRAPCVVRQVVEPRTGLSHARNAGLAASTTAVVAFIDDDARVAANWSAALLDVYRQMPDGVPFGSVFA